MSSIWKLATFFIAIILLSDRCLAMVPKALLVNKSVNSGIRLEYINIYHSNKSVTVPINEKFTVLFNENTYQPTVIHFWPVVPSTASPLFKFLLPGQTVLEQPILVILPGDSITVKFDQTQNTYEFIGQNQAELDFYKKVWQKNKIRFAGPCFEMRLSDTKMPLDQFLKKWYQLKLEGEALIAELVSTPGIRPQIAAFLARQIRLRIFTLLTLPAKNQSNRKPLIVFTKDYIDSVTVGARVLTEYQNAPANSTNGFMAALNSYISYKCIQLRQHPTCKAKYMVSKKEFSGFLRAWLCFDILQMDGVKSNLNISWLLQDYQRWVQPYGEFVRVLKGDPTVPLRSYKGVVFTDSLTNGLAQRQLLTELLERYKGQVVLLDLWASWCLPCVESIPASVAIGNKYRSKGLVVLFLSTDREPSKWQKGLKRLPRGAVANQFRFINPAASIFLKELEVTQIPRYVLIDRQGVVRYPDALSPSDPRLEAILEKMLLL